MHTLRRSMSSARARTARCTRLRDALRGSGSRAQGRNKKTGQLAALKIMDLILVRLCCPVAP